MFLVVCAVVLFLAFTLIAFLFFNFRRPVRFRVECILISPVEIIWRFLDLSV